MMKSLQGRTALITGGSKRIGRATALALGKEGVNIVIHYATSAKEAGDLRDELISMKVKAWTIKAEFTDPSEYETLISRVIACAGNLDILINNASFFSMDQIGGMDLAGLVRQIEVNAWVPLVLSREFERHRRGSIINILDARIARYDREHVSYLLSKQMLATLTRMTALEFAPAITVNAVAPGLILAPSGEDEQYLKKLAETVPLQRSGDPEDIAEAVIYLLKNDYLTGQILFLDGGQYLKENVHGPDYYH